ncbi:MAG TPA: YihY/virulence factor BrkB family protein, partial [Geothrix sp.]|nr:YihY/virulence factor BrkB family protein [Geothrix sp.]
GSQAYGKTLLTGLFQLLPYLPVDFVRDAIQNSQRIGHLGFSWGVLVVGGLWGVNQLDTSLSHVFGIRVKKHRQTRRFFLLRRISFVLGGMAMLTVFLALLAGGMVGHKLSIPRIASLGYLAPLMGLLVVTQVLQHLPRCHVHFRHAFLGALISSALWWVAQWAFGIYLAHTVTWGIMYGSLFKIIAGLIFLYYSCSIFLLGAEITAAFYRHDATGAVQVPDEMRTSGGWRRPKPQP